MASELPPQQMCLPRETLPFTSHIKLALPSDDLVAEFCYYQEQRKLPSVLGIDLGVLLVNSYLIISTSNQEGLVPVPNSLSNSVE